MPVDYPKMYAILCAAASDAIELLDAGQTARARERLKAALEQAEDLYLDAEDGDLILLRPEPRD